MANRTQLCKIALLLLMHFLMPTVGQDYRFEQCPGSLENSNAFGQLMFETLRVSCELYKEPYPLFQWGNPFFGNNTVKNLLFAAYPIDGETRCIFLKNDTTQFHFMAEIGYKRELIDFFIVAYPIAPGLITPNFQLLVNGKKCGRDNVGDLEDIDVKQYQTKPPQLPSTKANHQDKTFVVILAVLGFITALTTVFIILKVRRNCFHKEVPEIPSYEIKDRVVYISHCASKKGEIEKVLSLSRHLQSFPNVKVCIDLCNQNPIIDSGGLSIWIPENLPAADKIIMIFSPSYLKAIKTLKGTEDKFCKVNTEVNLIRTMLYNSCQHSSQLAVLLDGVKKKEIPAEFNGRAHFRFPKTYDNLDTDVIELVGYVLDIPPLGLPLKI